LQQDKDPLCKCLEPKWLLPVLGNILPVDSKIEVCLLSCCKWNHGHGWWVWLSLWPRSKHHWKWWITSKQVFWQV